MNICKGPYGHSDDRLVSSSSHKENVSPLVLQRIGGVAGDGLVQGAATSGQKLAEKVSCERELSPEGSDGGGGSLAFI